MVMNPDIIFYLAVGLETTYSQDLGWTLGIQCEAEEWIECEWYKETERKSR